MFIIKCSMTITKSIIKRQPQICSRLLIQNNFKNRNFYAKTPAETPNKKWWKSGLENVFGKYLILTNTISSGFLMAVGDLIEQQLELAADKKYMNSFDWQRNRNMAIIGIIQGPLIHFFYQTLDKYFPGIKMSSIMKKIFFDQTIASPISILIFFAGMNYMDDEDFEVSKDELKKKFWTVYAADCSIWIPLQFFNFYCLPTHYRVAFVNVVTMCYNVFLSYMKHKHST